MVSESISLKDKVVLVTGGTGSFGKKFTETVLANHSPKKLIIFSRDELKQFEMSQDFNDRRLRFFVGDVRDLDRLRRAMQGVDVVIHAAAMKRVEACEYNPNEAILTNVIGSRNVIEAALDNGVRKVMALSTDKAVNPANLYGATKLCSEKLFVQGNSYSAGTSHTILSCVRYGNVVGSRGSVVQIFKQQKQEGTVTVRDPRMTRFWLSLDQGVAFVIQCLDVMRGGEVFVPKIPSMNIMDLVRAIAPDSEVDYVGAGPGEKISEVLISEDEAREVMDVEHFFIILPSNLKNLQTEIRDQWPEGKSLEDGFRYASDSNDEWLTVDDLKKIVG